MELVKKQVLEGDIKSYSEDINKERKILSHSDIESLLEVVDRKVRTLELELSSIMSEKEETTLTEYIKEKVIYYGNFQGDYSNLLENDVQSAELISKLIGNINRIRVDIKKIEKTGLIRRMCPLKLVAKKL